MRDGTADPDDGQVGNHALTVGDDDDLLDQAAEELLTIAVAGSRCRPDRLQVRTRTRQPGPFLCTEWIRPVGNEARQFRLTLGYFTQMLLPAPLQCASNQTVLGLDPIELPPRAFCLEPRVLDQEVVLRSLCFSAAR